MTELRESDPPSRLVTKPFVLVTAATFAYFLSLGALLPTLPRYVEDELGGGGLEVGLAAGVFAISAAVIRPYAGRLGDRRGRRVLVVGGSLILGLSVMGYVVASSLAILLVLRLVSGVGEAAMFVGAATATQDLAPDDRRAEAASYYSVALYGGLAIGPQLGEWLVDGPGYDALFWVSGGIAVVAALLGTRVPVGDVNPDRPHGPLLHRAALAPGLVLFLGLIPFIGFATFLPTYGDDIGLEDVGPVFGAYAVSVLLIRLFGARIPDRVGWKVSCTVSLSAMAVASALLAMWASTAAVWIAAFTMAVGMSLLFPALFAAVIDRAGEADRSSAVGTFSVFFDLANGIGAPFLGLIVALAGERAAFGAAAGVAVAGFLALRLAGTQESAHIELTMAEAR